MNWCQVEMGEERGQQMCEVLGDLLGEPTPCAQGLTCPLVPRPRDGSD